MFMDYLRMGTSKIEQRVLIPNLIHKSVKVIHSLIDDDKEMQII